MNIETTANSGRTRLWLQDRTLRSAAALLCLAALIGVSFLNDRSIGAQSAFTHSLTTLMRAHFEQGSLTDHMIVGAIFVVYLAQTLAKPLIIYGAFTVVEILLVGPPKAWRLTLFALWVQIGLTITYLLISPLLNALTPAAWALQPLLLVEDHFFSGWAAPLGSIALALLASLIANFGQYWIHRLQHTIPILWRFHSVHHSIENMDALNSYTHPLDVIGEHIIALALAAIIGLKFDAMLWYIAFLNIHDRLLHTRSPINFGIFGVIFVDNRYHFMHHSINPTDYNCNYSSHFTLWDHLFGTYRHPHPFNEIVTGTIEKLPPKNLRQFFSATRDDRPIEDKMQKQR